MWETAIEPNIPPDDLREWAIVSALVCAAGLDTLPPNARSEKSAPGGERVPTAVSPHHLLSSCTTGA